MVVGFQGGRVVIAHISRCIIHRKSPHNPADGIQMPILPDRHDRSLEAPLVPSEPKTPEEEALEPPLKTLDTPMHELEFFWNHLPSSRNLVYL
jgi:hypothetical protein